MGRRGPKQKIVGGATSAFYLGVRHRAALKLFRERHGHENNPAAMRALLDVVAESEGVPEDPFEAVRLLEGEL